MNEQKQGLLCLKVTTDAIVRDGQINQASIQRLAEQVNAVQAAGEQVIVVSSAGRNRLGIDVWGTVVGYWRSALRADVMDYQLTEAELDQQGGLAELLAFVSLGGVAIVNGNDALMDEGNRYRNNDFVAAATIGHAACSGLFGNTQLGILSNVPGVLGDVTNTASVLRRYAVDDHDHLATDTTTHGNIGGMKTKFAAARIALQHRAKVWIAHHQAQDVVARAMAGDIGTVLV